MLSPGCVEQLIWRLIYVVVFSHAIKYNLLFSSNPGLYSLGHVKARCHASLDRSLQWECPWCKSCPYPALIEQRVTRRELAPQAGLGSPFSLEGAYRVTHLTKALHSFIHISCHGLQMNCNRVLPICWHLSLYREMGPHFTSTCSTWISETCYLLHILHTLHFENCLVKKPWRL